MLKVPPVDRVWHNNLLRSLSVALGLMLCATVVLGDDQLLNRRRAAVAGSATSQVSHSQKANLLEMRFRAAPRAESSVVKLGDIVEVISWGSHAKEDILLLPLAPAPKLGATQDWTSQDLLRHLQLRGIPASEIRWQGPESARLLRAQPGQPPTERAIDRTSHTPAFVQDRTITQAENNVAQAAREYLWLKTGDRTDWRIKAHVPTQYATTLAVRRNIIAIDGGEEPWTGPQLMTLVIKHQGEELELELELDIDLPPTVVVAVHSLRRDEVIEEDDVALASLGARDAEHIGDYFQSLEEVLGKQLRRSVSTGQPLARAAIGQPIVISSGELIEVESVSGPVSVKTAGKALSGGAVGDLINIELISSRKRLQATVVGPLQARIAGAAPIIQGKKK